MDGEGYDFFSQESAAGNTSAGTASGHGGSAPLRAGEEFDLNSQAANEFPHLGEYGAFLQGDGDGDQLVGRGRGHIRLGHLCDGFFFETLSVNGNIFSLELLQFGHGHMEVNRVPMQPKPQF
jgi:hypothetical protein